MNTLNYRSPARKSLHGKDGFIYLHSWGTGYQELVFTSHADAERFAKANDCKMHGRNAERTGAPNAP